MYRKVGYLKSGERRTFPKRFLYFDTESSIIRKNDKITDLPFKLGVAIYVQYDAEYIIKERIIYHFTDIEQFYTILTDLLNKRNTLNVVAHNIAHDIMTLNLVHGLHSLDFTSEPPILNNRLFIWRASHERGKLVFFDTANYSITSVSQLGKDLGFPKLSIDFTTATNDELFTYCQRDVEVLERFMENYLHFVKDNNLGGFSFSLASQALSAWKYRFMEQSVFMHNHPDLLQLERDGYHGGRTECFYIGTKLNEMHYYLDINSMYPFIMAKSLLPYRPASYNKNVSIKVLRAKMKGFYCLAKVRLHTKSNAYPLIYDDKLIFPVGDFTTVLHHSELEIALAENSIKEVLELATYHQAYLFADYVSFFYEHKVKSELAKDSTQRLMAKLFMNSLYGKFAQHNVIRRKLDGEFPDIIFRAGGYDTVKSAHFQEFIWFGQGYSEIKHGETGHSSPVLAGAITAGARSLLYQYIRQAGKANALYCDTDSLIVNSSGYSNLVDGLHPTELGKLKIEQQSTRLRIYAPKDYLFGNRKRHKGIPNNAERIDINAWLVDEWLGVKTWLQDGAKETPFITKRRKEARYVYTKGIVNPDTGYVSPICFGDVR